MHKKSKLYWCETEDHAEDFFVIAKNKKAATIFHSSECECEPEEVKAKYLTQIPINIYVEDGWADFNILNKLCTIHKFETPMIVEFNGQYYCEGYAEYLIKKECDDSSEENGRGRPNGTLNPNKELIKANKIRNQSKL